MSACVWISHEWENLFPPMGKPLPTNGKTVRDKTTHLSSNSPRWAVTGGGPFSFLLYFSPKKCVTPSLGTESQPVICDALRDFSVTP